MGYHSSPARHLLAAAAWCSGSVMIRTGSATSGTSGSLSMAVGSGDTHFGGRSSLRGGESKAILQPQLGTPLTSALAVTCC